MGIIVETVGRNGITIRSQTFNADSLSIGRGYDCDTILTDHHVDAVHLNIRLDPDTQQLVCEDHNSLNGSWLVEPSRFEGLHRNKRQVQGAMPIFSGQAFLLGRTYIRVYSSAHWVAPTQPLSAWEDFGHLLGRYWVVVLMAALLVLLEMWEQYLASPQTKKIVEYALGGFYPVLGAIAYGVVWAVVGRNAKHDGKFLTHVNVGLMTLFVVTLVQLFLPSIVYAVGWGGAQGVIQKLIAVVVGYSALSVTLIFATNLKRLPRNLFASVIPLALLIPFVVTLLTRSEFKSYPKYDRSLAGPEWSLRTSVTTEAFLSLAQKTYSNKTVSETPPQK